MRTTKAELSKLLFSARESIEMFADIVEGRTGRVAAQNRKLVEEIDAFRAEQGWNPNGFGREGNDEAMPERESDSKDE